MSLSPRVGALAGITGSLFFALMWTSASMADGGWRLGEMTLSELGDRSRAGHLLFNGGAMVTGVLSILYSLGLYRVLSSSRMGMVGSAVMGVASVLLIGVGVFPIDTGLPHTVVSYAFFACAAVGLALLVRPFANSFVFHPSMATFTAVVLLVCLGATLVLTIPAIEALAVGSLLLWSAVVSIRMLWHHPAR